MDTKFTIRANNLLWTFTFFAQTLYISATNNLYTWYYKSEPKQSYPVVLFSSPLYQHKLNCEHIFNILKQMTSGRVNPSVKIYFPIAENFTKSIQLIVHIYQPQNVYPIPIYFVLESYDFDIITRLHQENLLLKKQLAKYKMIKVLNIGDNIQEINFTDSHLEKYMEVLNMFSELKVADYDGNMDVVIDIPEYELPNGQETEIIEEYELSNMF